MTPLGIHTYGFRFAMLHWSVTLGMDHLGDRSGAACTGYDHCDDDDSSVPRRVLVCLPKRMVGTIRMTLGRLASGCCVLLWRLSQSWFGRGGGAVSIYPERVSRYTQTSTEFESWSWEWENSEARRHAIAATDVVCYCSLAGASATAKTVQEREGEKDMGGCIPYHYLQMWRISSSMA